MATPNPTAADPTAAFDQHEHDHRECVANAVASAERICQGAGARLTPIRRRVLELIWAQRKPVGAYQLLDALAAERGRVAPPTVYRAIEFLQAHGLVHRIESLNAFVGCIDPAAPHSGSFLICRDCGATAELEDAGIDAALTEGAARVGFRVEQRMVEMRGLCPACTGRTGGCHAA
jgi:Fur family zinc uptake transcriptional regulator